MFKVFVNKLLVATKGISVTVVVLSHEGTHMEVAGGQEVGWIPEAVETSVQKFTELKNQVLAELELSSKAIVKQAFILVKELVHKLEHST